MKVSHLLSVFILIFLSACTSQSEEQQSHPIGPPMKMASLHPLATDSPPIPDSLPLPDTIPPEPEADPIPKDILLGRFNPAKDEDFVKIETKHTTKADIYMRSAAYDAFIQMYEAAKEEGITLTILSATRNFYAQKGIWERKWTGQTKVAGKNLSISHPDPAKRALMILTYSSMPGTSRHHWGTDIDLNNLNNPWFESGQGLKTYEWLTAHAAEFGFCQPYSPKGENRPDGYNEEKWHWSYLPIATEFLRQYAEKITYDDITGFQGSEAASKIDVIPKYVEGINKQCLER